MHAIALTGCTSTPFGNYLKALGVLRLVSEQADGEARGWWAGETFMLQTELRDEGLIGFFLERYRPTPILAPWNGGSGFYQKDNKEGIEAIAGSSHERFGHYRESIAICRAMTEVQAGKSADEDERRTRILRHCRNRLPDGAVEWLDAAVGIAADGSRAFAPVVGTGGNEGRLDYTNNFMSRLAMLLIAPPPKLAVRELLANSLFATRTVALQAGAAGQFDPGRAGGANQGQGVESDSITNPWDLVLTLEGAVAWAAGLYRRQGASYRTVLCSPFTVRATRVGYGSASSQDEARAEVWTPLWIGRVQYGELKVLLREGRAMVDGRPARNALEFAEAASSLGVDRGIARFVRYSLLKRRGDSYVALPAGTFPAHYRSEADRIREFQNYYDSLVERDLPRGAEELKRGVEAAVFEVLLRGKDRITPLMRAFGRLVRQALTTSEIRLPRCRMKAGDWLAACRPDQLEVRIASALASIFTRDVGSMADFLSRADKRFSWIGRNLAERLVSVLTRRLQLATAIESKGNPLGAAYGIHAGDATLFIEGSTDDAAIEELMFAFLALDWSEFERPGVESAAAPLPSYGVLKCLFLPGEIKVGAEPRRLLADSRIVPLLTADRIGEATKIAVQRLQIAGFRPLDLTYEAGVDGTRLGAALLIPVLPWTLPRGIFKEPTEMERTENEPEFAE